MSIKVRTEIFIERGVGLRLALDRRTVASRHTSAGALSCHSVVRGFAAVFGFIIHTTICTHVQIPAQAYSLCLLSLQNTQAVSCAQE